MARSIKRTSCSLLICLPAWLIFAVSSAYGYDNDNAEFDSTKQQETAKIMTPGKLTRSEQIQFAVEDLSTRINLGSIEIQTLSATQVTWRSGAMGCPQPGMNYTEAMVPGVLIILAAEGKQYRYHGSRHGRPKYCPDGRSESPSPTGNEI